MESNYVPIEAGREYAVKEVDRKLGENGRLEKRAQFKMARRINDVRSRWFLGNFFADRLEKYLIMRHNYDPQNETLEIF